MKLLTDTKEPVFAAAVRAKQTHIGRVLLWFDVTGFPACCNVSFTEPPRLCSVCRNACVRYHLDDHGEYTCSACGMFPPELLIT